MRNVSIEELEADTAGLISEVEAGRGLTLIRGGKAVADIVPHAEEKDRTPDFPEREAARKELLAIMDAGLDLGGKPFTYEERHGR